MATGKRYFWIKLRDNFFSDDGPADFLMGQPNGANYVVLYQLLCLKTINTGGRLESHIGEVIVKYDIEKIRRACKYFTVDTIMIALELYKTLGLIYEDVGGVLVLANHREMVGSETDWAAKKQRQRVEGKPPEQLPPGDNTMDSSGDTGGDSSGDTGGDIVPIEIRDKRLDIRDIDNKGKEEKDNTAVPAAEPCGPEVRQIVVSAWNSIGLTQITKIVAGTTRYVMLNARLREHGLPKILQAIENIKNSDFARGQNNRGWVATFDWMIKPNNFLKVLEGNYNNRKEGGVHGGENTAAQLDGRSSADAKWGITGNL